MAMVLLKNYWLLFKENLSPRYNDLFVNKGIYSRVTVLLKNWLFFKENLSPQSKDLLVKFKYSEKATKFCKISTVDLTGTTEDKMLWPSQKI